MRARSGVGLIAIGILGSSCGRDSIETPQYVAPWLTSVTASASLVVTGDSVFSSLTVKNIGATTQTVQFAPCTYLGPLSLRVFAPSATKPSWDSALSVNGPCFTAIEKFDLKAGASHMFQQVNDVNEILGDSLPSGSYVLAVSGRNLTPAAATELGTTTLSLTKHAVPAATISFTTDATVYTAAASGTAPFIQYTFTVVARYANNGATPITLLNACGPHPTWSIFGVGNNVGISPYDPQSLCLVPTPPLILAPGAVRVDTIQFHGPAFTLADGTPEGTLYGQFRITYRAGSGCNTFAPPCLAQPSSVFAVRLP